jgi:hypothetical protein
MKKCFLLLTAAMLGLGLLPVRAQFGSPATGSAADDVMTKVFGDTLNFSADLETQVKMMPKQDNMTMTGKIFFAGGNSRAEMDMTSMKGSQMTPQVIAQMKSMGMDKMVSISRAHEKVVYMIYPGLQAYAKMELPDANKNATNDFKVETTKLGEETVDGHPCVKNQYSVNNPRTGQRLIMTAWNATDLKNVPVKIEQSAWSSTDSYAGTSTTMRFLNLNLAQPDASLFQPPSDYKKYDSIQTLMQAAMMKKMGGLVPPPMARPPGQ